MVSQSALHASSALNANFIADLQAVENIPEVIEQTLKVHNRLKGHVKKLENKADPEAKANLCCKYCGMQVIVKLLSA